jgi:acetyltransferase-like isoleucine patch superfamily enzyme
MIISAIKKMMINVGLFVLELVPKNGLTKKLHRFFYLRWLLHEDYAVAIAEMARDVGMKVGKDCRLYTTNFQAEPFLIELGDHVLVADDVHFITHDGGVYTFQDEIPNIVGNYGKIKIGNNCFIGFGAYILPNVELGNNCIVGAGSVVVDSFPDNSVIFGNPAKLIFKTELYKKMKLMSKHTLIDDKYSFPGFNTLPPEVRKRFILDRIDDIPMRKPKKR